MSKKYKQINVNKIKQKTKHFLDTFQRRLKLVDYAKYLNNLFPLPNKKLTFIC